MDEDVSVSTDWGGEMSVQFDSETIMESFVDVDITKWEVNGLIHAPGRHYSDKLVDLWISRSFSFIHAFGKFLRSFN